MYLKSIEVQGFKSFANKINFQFHNGITAIVGPNGSGKSNVADAVRWVLGEQKIKQLRGSSMQDVIFSGTEMRKPLSYAYVAITLDNQDHQLSIDYDEVTVARRLYRSGESEYLINGAACRLKDVYELFYDTGIGKEGYSIIGQGQIDKILSGKPEEKRELFDEAAGIVKFKRRKAAAQKKLEEENRISEQYCRDHADDTNLPEKAAEWAETLRHLVERRTVAVALNRDRDLAEMKILVEQQVIPALGHNYISEVTLEPTCTTEGTRTYTCSNDCGETYTEVIPALGHNYISEVIKPATCAEEGLRKYTCTRCGDSYEEVIPKLDHQTAIREENRIEPDCTNTGSYDKVTYCTVCNEELTRETIVIPATGHKPGAIVVENSIAPDCTTAGSYENVTYCTVCGEELSRTLVTVQALGHDYGDWVITKEATETEAGERQKTCTRCGDIITEEIPATGPIVPPEEPETAVYYAGAFGRDTAYDTPDFWMEFNDAGVALDSDWRITEYFNNLKTNSITGDPETLVVSDGEPIELAWALTIPETDETWENWQLENLGEVQTTADAKTYPALALPTGYTVTTWLDQASQPIGDIQSVAVPNEDYNIFYAVCGISNGDTKTFKVKVEKG